MNVVGHYVSKASSVTLLHLPSKEVVLVLVCSLLGLSVCRITGKKQLWANFCEIFERVGLGSRNS